MPKNGRCGSSRWCGKVRGGGHSDQVPGQEHQGEGEIDAASWCATSPMTFAVEDLYTRTGEVVPGSQIKQPCRQEAAGLVTESLL